MALPVGTIITLLEWGVRDCMGHVASRRKAALVLLPGWMGTGRLCVHIWGLA